MVLNRAAFCVLWGKNRPDNSGALPPGAGRRKGKILLSGRFSKKLDGSRQNVEGLLGKTTKQEKSGENLKKTTDFVHSLFIVPGVEIE
jgi:hypothetical protein